MSSSCGRSRILASICVGLFLLCVSNVHAAFIWNTSNTQSYMCDQMGIFIDPGVENDNITCLVVNPLSSILTSRPDNTLSCYGGVIQCFIFASFGLPKGSCQQTENFDDTVVFDIPDVKIDNETVSSLNVAWDLPESVGSSALGKSSMTFNIGSRSVNSIPVEIGTAWTGLAHLKMLALCSGPALGPGESFQNSSAPITHSVTSSLLLVPAAAAVVMLANVVN